MKSIKSTTSINTQDLTALSIGEDVLFVPQISIERGTPNVRTLAGARLASPHDRAGVIVTIEFHGGRRQWAICTEHIAAQRRTEWDFDILPLVIAKFEELAEVKLPPMKVVEAGLGIYEARERYTSNNPWQMQEGSVYEFDHRGKCTRYLATCVNGSGVRIVRLDEDGGHLGESVDPKSIFGVHEWESMKHVPEPVPRPFDRRSLIDAQASEGMSSENRRPRSSM